MLRAKLRPVDHTENTMGTVEAGVPFCHTLEGGGEEGQEEEEEEEVGCARRNSKHFISFLWVK